MKTGNTGMQNPCPRCGRLFSCQPAQIENCDCRKIRLDKSVAEMISSRYQSCLCLPCLGAIAAAGLRASVILLMIFFLGTGDLLSQTFPPPAGQPGSTAIHYESPLFRDWARTCTVKRGYMDISNPNLGRSSAGDSSLACAKALSNGVVSLGDGGAAVCMFNAPVMNGPGYDFAVFENSFDGNFLELAFVEVSSDGVNFFRFPAESTADTVTQSGTFDNSDARNFNNLAGKYAAGYGTPFDLEELKTQPGLDVNAITHIRVLDVVGTLLDQYCSRDSKGRKINDPWPTAFAQGGFDLDAIGIISSASSLSAAAEKMNAFYLPSVLKKGETLVIQGVEGGQLELMDLQGHLLLSDKLYRFDSGGFAEGIYLLRVSTEHGTRICRLIIY